MNRSIIASIPALALLAAVGCQDPDGDPPIDCTDEFVTSVVVDVVDDDGNLIEDATGVYTVDGGPEQDCEGAGGELACGGEEAGDFAITVDGFGYAAETIELTVGQGECHVIQEYVEVTLGPVSCTEEVVPSVVVTVTDSDGEAILDDVEVAWNMASEDDLPEPCWNVVDNEWSCAEEVSGELAIEVSAEGYVDAREIVTVGFDECHVITESIQVALDAM